MKKTTIAVLLAAFALGAPFAAVQPLEAKQQAEKPVGKTVKKSRKTARQQRRKRYLAIAREVKPGHVPISLVDAVIEMESGYRPKAVGAAGEMGLMQIKPATARLVRRKYNIKAGSLHDPRHNIHVGTALLGHCHTKAKGDLGATIGCYNAGEGNMWRWRKFAITRKYVRFVRRRIARN